MKNIFRNIIIISIFLVCIIVNTFPAFAEDVKGIISSDATWTVENSPYNVIGDILIQENTILVIDPGVVVRFNTPPVQSIYYYIQVDGTLDAQGNEDNPILFTAQEKTSPWGYIKFTDTSVDWDEAASSVSILSNCIIEYGGNGDGGATVQIDSASPMIRDNVIRYSSGDGIFSSGDSKNILNNRIHNNLRGIVFLSDNEADVLISNNYLINNLQGIYLDSNDKEIKVSDNTIISSSPEVYGSCISINLQYHNILSYFWEQIEGTSVVITDPYSPEPSFFAPDAVSGGETLTFRLFVMDEYGLISTDTVDVNVNWENNPPVAAAGSDQTVGKLATITLNGSSSYDSDDGIASYLWEQTTGTSVILSDSTAVSTTFTSPDVITGEEILIFQLTVTDIGNLQSSDTIIINVTADTGSPVAAAGDDQNVDARVPVILSGFGSTDPASYLWEQTKGTSVILSNPTTLYPTFTSPNVETDGEALYFQLTVTDNSGLQSIDIVIINVSAGNQPPVADAGSIQTVDEGDTVTLNGSGSTDPDDGIASYLWEQTSGTSTTLYNDTSDQPHFTAIQVDTAGETLVFQLTVTDYGGLQSSDTVIVNVTEPGGNIPPIADAGSNQTVDEGDTVILDGSNSNNPDNIAKISINNNQIVNNNIDGNAIAIAGELYANCVLNVTNNNIDNSEGNLSVYLYNWQDEIDSDNPTGISMTNNWWGTSDENELDAMIYDFNNDYNLPEVIFKTDAQQLPIEPIPNAGSDLSYPPIADAGEDQTDTDPTGENQPIEGSDIEVTLDGSGSYDPDNIMTYEWVQTEGPEVTIFNANTVKPTFISPLVDEDGTQLVFQLTVRPGETVEDGAGFWDTDEVVIIVNADDETEYYDDSGCFISTVM